MVPLAVISVEPLSLPLGALGFGRNDVLTLPFRASDVRSLSDLYIMRRVNLNHCKSPLSPSKARGTVTRLGQILGPDKGLCVSLPLSSRGGICFGTRQTFSRGCLMSLFCPLRVVSGGCVCKGRFLSRPDGKFNVKLCRLEGPRTGL